LRNRERLDLLLHPPRGFVTAPVERAVMEPAERHREFVAHAAAERRTLGKP